LKQALENSKKGNDITPQSFLYKELDAQAIVNQYAGTGTLVYYLNSGGVKEYVNLDRPAGRYYNTGKKKYMETSRVCIAYTNKGTHVFAVKPERG